MIETNHLQPRIRNHNSVIIPVGKSFRIIKRKFSGTGTMGRTLDRGGANAVIYHGASPYQPPEKYTAEVVINHRSITGLRKRASPNTVMNGSAYDHTGIVNSEYLHRIAHSLGGSDTSDNLTPGYHALNTAMIPIENFVHDLAANWLDVTYKVQLFSVGNDIWVSQAHIHMTVTFKRNVFIYYPLFVIHKSRYAISSKRLFNSTGIDVILPNFVIYINTISLIINSIQKKLAYPAQILYTDHKLYKRYASIFTWSAIQRNESPIKEHAYENETNPNSLYYFILSAIYPRLYWKL